MQKQSNGDLTMRVHTKRARLAAGVWSGITLILAAALVSAANAQTALNYQKPPAAIEELLDAPSTPIAHLSPDRSLLLTLQPQSHPTIVDVAQPRLRLAGLRFSPHTNGPNPESDDIALGLEPIGGGAAKTITGLPAKLRATHALWSPDSRYVAFVQRSDTALELWIVDIAAAHAHRVGLFRLNAILGAPCAWMPSSSALLCNIVPATRGAAPQPSDIPTGPHISENIGKVTPAPTYEDMLSTPEDEKIFEYYASGQLALVPLTGPIHPLPVKGLLSYINPSPDGSFALVSLLHRPFSYTVPAARFPTLTEVVTLKTGATKTLFDRPVVDNLPISHDAVAPGPRDYEWRADVPATMVWAEAAENGAAKPTGPVADRLLELSAPFTGEPSTLLELPMHLARGGGGGGGNGVRWGNEHLALVSISRFSDRKTMMLSFDPSAVPAKTSVIYEGSSQDRYHSPGEPIEATNAAGKRVLELTADSSAIYFVSPGASPGGDMPFVATMPLTGGKETILFRSAAPYYTEPVAVLANATVFVHRESQTESPNYFAATLSADPQFTLVTHFPSPYAGIKMPSHQLLNYKRADGLDLTATLWLPYGYDKSQGPLPTLVEAYPAEFKTRADAGQVAGSPYRFPTYGWGGTPVFFTQTGYAVMENAAIPIIGEGKAEPNDTYVEQLVNGAKAAVDAGVATGTVDRNRVGVMGHSYGAFMTANLLAHTNIFRAGIARSGAYNRTLTPYGFQNEERTYWQDPKVYFDMSPFSYADKIKAPILLVHGEADDNSGTYPIQSERFFAALKGQGATVRLVFLPLEPHHYGAEESLQHMLWEMNRWLDTYVKPEVSPVKTAAGQ
jgi:dipeptidyl aminopeptidase/acylaminoacyl peptidase